MPAERLTAAYVDKFATQYVVTALWSSMDDDGTPLDRNYDVRDLAPDTLARMLADCRAFTAAYASDLADLEPEQAGHDFWLTRNRHGAGYWDRDLGARGERLTDAANTAGELDLYVGDDSRLYLAH